MTTTTTTTAVAYQQKAAAVSATAAHTFAQTKLQQTPHPPVKTIAAASQQQQSNGGGCDGHAPTLVAGQAETNCDCCGRTHPEEDAHGEAPAGESANNADGDSESIAVGAARTVAPAPPAGPVGFSSPAARTTLVQQPLGQKASCSPVRASFTKYLFVVPFLSKKMVVGRKIQSKSGLVVSLMKSPGFWQVGGRLFSIQLFLL